MKKIPKSTNMAVYLRHFLGAYKAKVFTESPMPQPLILSPSDVALATNLRKLEERVHPGMIIMAPSPKEKRRAMGYLFKDSIDEVARTAGINPEFMKKMFDIESSDDFKPKIQLHPHQERAMVALADGMVPARALGDGGGMSYLGIQRQRMQLNEFREPTITIPQNKFLPTKIKKASS